MKSLLFEIGTEEIPARFVLRGLTILKEELTHFLDSASIDYGDDLRIRHAEKTRNIY